MMKKQLLFLSFCLLASNLLFAATITWNGNTSTTWSTASNWTGGIPVPTDDIIIPAGRPNYPIILLSDPTVSINKTLVIQNGGSLTVGNTSINGDLQFTVDMNGVVTINSGGTLTMTGSTTNFSYIFLRGVINNSGNVVLNNNGDIYFDNTNGDAATFNCVSSGTITTNSGGLLDGQGTHAGCTYTNPASGFIGSPGLPDCITFSNGLTNNGTMRFDLKAGTACTDFDRIAVTGTMTFGGTFTAVDGGVNIGNALQVITYTSRSGTFTNSNVNLGGGKFANVAYGPTALTLNIGSTPLPVEFISFDANTEGGKNKLTWSTASEIRSQEYAVERSDDGTKFYQIGTVKAKGSAANYSFIDATPKFGINYYRLKQVDTDGTFTYTKTEAVETGKGKKSIKVFPTTTEGGINIQNDDLTGVNVSVFNAMGQLVYARKLTNSIDLSGMVAGMYFIEVQTGNGKVTEKVFKK